MSKMLHGQMVVKDHRHHLVKGRRSGPMILQFGKRTRRGLLQLQIRYALRTIGSTTENKRLVIRGRRTQTITKLDFVCLTKLKLTLRKKEHILSRVSGFAIRLGGFAGRAARSLLICSLCAKSCEFNASVATCSMQKRAASN